MTGIMPVPYDKSDQALAMTDEERLRAASDVMTPPHVLHALFMGETNPWFEGRKPSLEIIHALRLNPSLPMRILIAQMAYYSLAWENPSAPLALLEQPALVEHAQVILADLMHDSAMRQGGDLREHIRRVASMTIEGDSKKVEKKRKAQAFARLLASLYAVTRSEP